MKHEGKKTFGILCLTGIFISVQLKLLEISFTSNNNFLLIILLLMFATEWVTMTTGLWYIWIKRKCVLVATGDEVEE